MKGDGEKVRWGEWGDIDDGTSRASADNDVGGGEMGVVIDDSSSALEVAEREKVVLEGGAVKTSLHGRGHMREETYMGGSTVLVLGTKTNRVSEEVEVGEEVGEMGHINTSAVVPDMDSGNWGGVNC
jgi:hypothetical protein